MAGSSLKSGLRRAAKWAFAAADFPYRTRPGPRILIYHQIEAGLGRQMEVTRRAFEYQLAWLLENGQIVTLDEALSRAGEADAHRLFVLTFDDGYRDIYENAVPLLESAGVPYLVYVTTGPVDRGHGSDPAGRDMPLTWAQLEEISTGGATIGAHTHTHPDLRSLTPADVEREMEESDRLIEGNLGIVPRDFCYPYGHWAEAAHRIVIERYATATLGAGPPVTGATSPHLVHRVPVQLSDTDFFFRRKMESGMVSEERVRRLISGYKGV